MRVRVCAFIATSCNVHVCGRVCAGWCSYIFQSRLCVCGCISAYSSVYAGLRLVFTGLILPVKVFSKMYFASNSVGSSSRWGLSIQLALSTIWMGLVLHVEVGWCNFYQPGFNPIWNASEKIPPYFSFTIPSVIHICYVLYTVFCAVMTFGCKFASKWFGRRLE